MKGDKFNIWHYMVFMTIFVLYYLFRWDLSLYFDSFGSNLVLGLILIVFIFAYFILIIVNIISFFFHLIKDKSKCKKIILKLLILASLIFCFILGNTVFFIKLNFRFYENERIKAINMYKNGEMQRLDEYRYISPNRFISYDKIIYIEKDGDSIKAVFTLMSLANIIYIDDDELVFDKNFKIGIHSFESGSLKKIEDNWYFFNY